jgi:hypothetical protein
VLEEQIDGIVRELRRLGRAPLTRARSDSTTGPALGDLAFSSVV